MKTLKNIAAVLSLLVLGSVAQAHDGAVAAEFELPITQGHSQVDAGFNLDDIGEDQGSDISGRFSYEYFVANRFSVGGAVSASYQDIGSITQYSLAPSATYYFMTFGHWAMFVNQTVGYQKTEAATSEDSFQGTTSLGGAHFFNHAVAFTPRLTANYAEDRGGELEAMGAFTVYF